MQLQYVVFITDARTSCSVKCAVVYQLLCLKSSFERSETCQFAIAADRPVPVALYEVMTSLC